jgi:hypothetical protein
MDLVPIDELVAQATKLNPTFKHDVSRVTVDDAGEAREMIRVSDTATIGGTPHVLTVDLPVEQAHRQVHLERQNILMSIRQLGRS